MRDGSGDGRAKGEQEWLVGTEMGSYWVRGNREGGRQFWREWEVRVVVDDAGRREVWLGEAYVGQEGEDRYTGALGGGRRDGENFWRRDVKRAWRLEGAQGRGSF